MGINIDTPFFKFNVGSTTSTTDNKKIKKADKGSGDTAEINNSKPTDFEGNLSKLKDFANKQASTVKNGETEEAPKTRGNITKGLILAGLGATGIAAASFIPGVGVIAPGLLNSFIRLVSVVAIGSGASHIGDDTRIPKSVRALALIGMGVASVAAGVGAFGPIGGLTAIALCVGGALSGILTGVNTLAQPDVVKEKKEPSVSVKDSKINIPSSQDLIKATAEEFAKKES
jgi:hypothetical protein